MPIQIMDFTSYYAQQMIDMGILTKKSYDDCIISWNFKHIVNIKTIRGVRAITNLRGYKPVEIINSSVLLGSEIYDYG